MLQFTLSGLLALVLVGAGLVLVLRHQAAAESLRDARRLADVLARTSIEPALVDGIVRRDPQAIARMDAIVRERVLRDPVVRLKIWTQDGRSRRQAPREDEEADREGEPREGCSRSRATPPRRRPGRRRPWADRRAGRRPRQRRLEASRGMRDAREHPSPGRLASGRGAEAGVRRP